MPDSNVRWLVNQHTPLPFIYNNLNQQFVHAVSIYQAIVIPEYLFSDIFIKINQFSPILF